MSSKLTRFAFLPLFAVAAFLLTPPRAHARALPKPGPRRVISLDRGWRLMPLPDFRGWAAEPVMTPEQLRSLHEPGYRGRWQSVNLPDDYIVRGRFQPNANAALTMGGHCGFRECGPNIASARNSRRRRTTFGGHGYLPLYPAWYARKIFIPIADRGKNIWLHFGGIYRDAAVFLNGKFLIQHPSGYTAFRLNITADVRYGQNNRLAVFVDPRWLEGWFYEGGGIYRHVRLIVTDKLHVAPWGAFVIAKLGPIQRRRSGDDASAVLRIQTTVRNDHRRPLRFTLLSRVLSPTGQVVARTSRHETLAAGVESTFSQRMTLAHARLWSLAARNLYRLETVLRRGRRTADHKFTAFGIRSIVFDPNRGFLLNGRRVEIRGAANHQDFPGVGIGVPDNLWSWRIAKLKAMGANAYRTAHNPLDQAFYRACDRLGMLVMDENRHFGDTYAPKSAGRTPYASLADLKAMVLQHRNHPSIIMWSMFNEEGLQKSAYGARLMAAMKAAVRQLDPTRPITSAMNGGYTKKGALSVEDLLGMNYHTNQIAQLHREFPGKTIFGSESVNAKSSRGTLHSRPATGRCSQYGCKLQKNGGPEPWESWVPAFTHPFVAGEFFWTGFDYRGEPNPYSWPAVTSQTGAMDLCGFPKANYHYWNVMWSRQPRVYIFPRWNFPAAMRGQAIRVRAYANTARVGLWLNGKSLGQQAMPQTGYLDWQVPYAPGVLLARAYNRQGRQTATDRLHTPGPAVALRLRNQFPRLRANGEDITPLAVRVVDAHGRLASNATNLVRFSVAGPAAIAGVCNGDPASHEANFARQRRAFHGLAMVLVRAATTPGRIVVRARAAGLRPAQIVITSRKAH